MHHVACDKEVYAEVSGGVKGEGACRGKLLASQFALKEGRGDTALRQRDTNSDSRGGPSMGELALQIQESGSSAETSATNVITPDERAMWLVDYIASHLSHDRSHLLRKAVEQITAAEARAYERGWRDALQSVEEARYQPHATLATCLVAST
jgi:hypothetical protein